jgi:ABC-type transport system substrate-binding protein
MDEEYNQIILRTCLTDRILTFDPIMNVEYYGGLIIKNVHAGLLSIGASGEISPGIAKNWHVEEDNLTWIFDLRKGARFQNNREITGDDVKYSFQRLLSPRVKSPNSWFLQCIEGAREFENGIADDVKGIKVLDKYRVSVKLNAPYSEFLSVIAHFVCSIVPKEEIEKDRVVGCGPYMLEEASDSGCVLKAFTHFYGGAPYVDKMVFEYAPDDQAQILLYNQYDLIIVDNRALKDKVDGSEDITLKMSNIMATYYAGFNLESGSELIKNKEIRKAINQGVNKKRIMSEILSGMAVESRGPLPPNMLDDRNLNGYSYNLKAAKEIIQKCRFNEKERRIKILAREADGSPLSALYNKITDYIIEDINAIGIQCTVGKVASAKYIQEENMRKCDLFLSRWIADMGDPDNFLQSLFNPASMTDFTRYNNSSILEKLDIARKMVNPNKRANIYREVQQIITDDAPFIFLFHPQFAIACRRNVSGIKMNPLGLIAYEDIMLSK